MAISRHNLVPDLPDNNFATFDKFYSDHHTLSQGNLSAYSTDQSASFAYANFALPNFGKWYVEICVAAGIGGARYSHMGVQPAMTRNQHINRILARHDNYIWVGNASSPSVSELTGQHGWANGDIMSMLHDSDSQTLTFYKNGQNPKTYSYLDYDYSLLYYFFVLANDAMTHVINFGQNPDFSENKTDYSGGDNPDGSWSDANGIGRFYYQPPTGALALCSRNLQPAVSFRGYDFEETGKALTYNGNAKISKNSPYMARGSLEFSNSGDFTESTISPIGTSDFTVDCWVYHHQLGSQETYMSDPFGPQQGVYFYKTTADQLGLYTNGSPFISTETMKAKQWNFIRLVRKYGEYLKAYLNGQELTNSPGNDSATYGYNLDLTETYWCLGNSTLETTNHTSSDWAATQMKGYIAEPRLLMRALEGEEATQVPTEPYAMTDDDIRFDLRSSSMKLNGGTKSVPISPYNTPSKQRANALTSFGGGSFEFDSSSGTGIKIVNPNLNIGRGEFTVEFWARFTEIGRASFIDSNTGFQYYTGNDSNWTNTVYDRTGLGSICSGNSQSNNVGRWVHHAVVRKGITISIYENGVSVGSGTCDSNFTIDEFTIGGNFRLDLEHFPGQIADYHIMNKAKEDPSLVPTEPITATENTVFLAQPYRMKPGVGNMNIASKPLTDETGKALTYVGNPKTSTDGPTSDTGSFDFNYDSALTIPISTNDTLGSGDFAIEFWLYFKDKHSNQTTSENYQFFVGMNGLVGNFWGIYYYGGHSGRLLSFVGSSASSAGTEFNVDHLNDKRNTWTHIAYTRASGTMRLFVNGENVKDWAEPADFSDCHGALEIGGYGDLSDNDQLNGKIADFRITKGEALYTSNFNPFNRPASADISGTVVLDLSSEVSLSAAENPTQHFKQVIWTGQTNGDAYEDGNITTGFQPDLVWVKRRSPAANHWLTDSVRGPNKQLSSSKDDEEQSYSGNVTEFKNNGFVVGDDPGHNQSGHDYVSWAWKAGGAPADGKMMKDGEEFDVPTTGSIIPSKMSVNTKAGFSIVKYEGASIEHATLPHGFNQKPDFVVIKGLSGSGTTGTGGSFNMSSGAGWPVYHSSMGLASARLDDVGGFGSTTNNNWKAVDDTTISFGVDSWVNCSGVTYIAYCWHAVPGYSVFGSYEGNAS